jgi:K+-transporting ATPase ATPase C chain
MAKLTLQSFLVLMVFTILTGVIYPVTVTMIAQATFAHQANGSLIKSADGKVIGSELLGQQFSDAKYFFSRPSSTAPFAYNAAGSAGSNLGPTNADLFKQMGARIEHLQPEAGQKVPVDLVTASASGLDPHITPEAAIFQIDRIAKARNLDSARVRTLVDQFVEQPQMHLFGEPRVNVLKLNIALDGLK